MKVWFVRQSNDSTEFGSNEYFILFSTQEKAKERFMELIESNEDLWGEYMSWELSDDKTLVARYSRNSEYECHYLNVGSYEIDSGEILEY